jgi:hypothetical protein
MEQTGGDEATVMKNMDEAESPEWLFGAMTRIVKASRSDFERKHVERLFAWCLNAKQPLRMDYLEHIWTLDTSRGKFDVRKEIKERSSR